MRTTFLIHENQQGDLRSAIHQTHARFVRNPCPLSNGILEICLEFDTAQEYITFCDNFHNRTDRIVEKNNSSWYIRWKRRIKLFFRNLFYLK